MSSEQQTKVGGHANATVNNPHPPEFVLFMDLMVPLQDVQFVCEWRPAQAGEFYLHTDKSGRNQQVMARMDRDDNFGVIRPVVVGLISNQEQLIPKNTVARRRVHYVSGGNK